MDEITKGLLIGGAFSLLTPLIPAVINFLSQKTKNRAELGGINVTTIEKLSQQLDRMVDEQIEDRERMDKIADELERVKGELRRYVNAYARLIKFSRKHIPAEIDIPNFLETDPKINTL